MAKHVVISVAWMKEKLGAVFYWDRVYLLFGGLPDRVKKVEKWTWFT